MVCVGLVCLLLQPALARANEICDTAGWQPGYDKKNLKCGTQPSNNCKKLRETLLIYNDDYNNTAKSACEAAKKAEAGMGDLSQESSKATAKQMLQSGTSSVQALIDKNAELLKKIPKDMEPAFNEMKNAGAPAAPFVPRVEKIAKTASDENVKTEVIKEEEARTSALPPAPKSSLAGISSASSFVEHLKLEQRKNKTALAKLNQLNTKIGGDPAPTGGGGGGGGGFDLSSLLPLAAPLAGLAMMAQQKKDAAADSSLSGQTPPVTPVTPESPGSTSLTDTAKTAATNVGTSNTGQMPKVNDPILEDAFVGAGSSEVTAASAPGAGKAGGGSGGGSFGGFSGGAGSSGTGGSSTAKADDGRGLASAAKPVAEEAMAFAGGAGGGGLNFTPSAAATDESHAPDALLSSMEAAVEDPALSFNGFQEEGAAQASASDIASADSEFLFSRVRACYQRSMKKGQVLSGLGEKIGE